MPFNYQQNELNGTSKTQICQLFSESENIWE